MSYDTCGYSVQDEDGFDGPCMEPATSWRWYQDVEHEDVLLPACDIHENRGGIRMHAAEEAARVLRMVGLGIPTPESAVAHAVETWQDAR